MWKIQGVWILFECTVDEVRKGFILSSLLHLLSSSPLSHHPLMGRGVGLYLAPVIPERGGGLLTVRSIPYPPPVIYRSPINVLNKQVIDEIGWVLLCLSIGLYIHSHPMNQPRLYYGLCWFKPGPLTLVRVLNSLSLRQSRDGWQAAGLNSSDATGGETERNCNCVKMWCVECKHRRAHRNTDTTSPPSHTHTHTNTHTHARARVDTHSRYHE